MTAQKKRKPELEDAEQGAKLEAVEDVDEPEPGPEPKVDEVEMVAMKFRGAEFKIPKLMDEWPTEACLAMSQGNYTLSAKLLLNRAQWAHLMELGDKRKDIRAFLTVFADVVDRECVA